jgi:ATP-dependent Clp protease adaptor protein ClpS
MNGKGKSQTYSQTENDTLLDDVYTLWLINDDYNTFDFVAACLMELCNHSYEQAMQCALITHHHGKCDILEGSYSKLKPIAVAMFNRGLTVKIVP